MERVFSIVRQRYGLTPTDQMKNLDVNTAIWSIFMSVTLQAAVSSWWRLHRKSAIHEESTQEFVETVISCDWEVDHRSDRNEWTDHDWLAACYVERDDCSVCHCKNLPLFWPSAVSGRYQYWTSQSLWKQDQLVSETRYRKDLDRIDGEPMAFERNNFQGFTRLGILDEIQKTMTESKCELEQFKGRIIFMSMSLIGQKLGNKKDVLRMLSVLLSMLEYSRKDIGRFWCLGPRRLVRNPRQQTWWRMEENCWRHDAQLCRKRTSCISCQQRLRQRRTEK